MAGLPTYFWEGQRDPGLDHYEPFGSGARWVLGRRARAALWRPTLIVGSRSGYATELALDPSWEPRRSEVWARLLAAVAERAEELGAASLGVMWLTSETASALAPCLRRSQDLVLAGPNSSIEIAWDSFEGYLSWLRHSRRRSALRERARFAASGLGLELTDLGSSLTELAPLALRLQERHGHSFSAPEMLAQLRAQARELNSESRVLLCRRRGRAVGFSLLYSWGGRLYGRLAGFDYEETLGSDAYFNLAFYEPLELALREGLRSFHLGMATWAAKALRGAAFDPAWILVCPPGRVRGVWSRARSGRDLDDARWWQGRFPQQVDPARDWRWTRAGLLSNSAATTSRQ